MSGDGVPMDNVVFDKDSTIQQREGQPPIYILGSKQDYRGSLHLGLQALLQKENCNKW
jgi:hypothetical protein